MIVLEQFQGDELSIQGGQPGVAYGCWGAHVAVGTFAGERDAQVCGRIAPEYALKPAPVWPIQTNLILNEPVHRTGSYVRY